jgi:hypothetical protein
MITDLEKDNVIRTKRAKRLIGRQDLLAARLGIGMGSRILTALTSTGTATIQLFAIGGMSIAYQGLTSFSEDSEG